MNSTKILQVIFLFIICYSIECIAPTFRTAGNNNSETTIIGGYWLQPYLDKEPETSYHHDYPKVLLGINKIGIKKFLVWRTNLDFSLSMYFMGWAPLAFPNFALHLPFNKIFDALLVLKCSGIFPTSSSLLISKNVGIFITPYMDYSINWAGYFYQYSPNIEYNTLAINYLQILNFGLHAKFNRTVGIYIEGAGYSIELERFHFSGIGGGISLDGF
jgi:hypothetical protein